MCSPLIGVLAVIPLHRSGSMRRKLVDVLAAARTFAQASHPQDEMFVVNFNEKVTAELPRSSLPADLEGGDFAHSSRWPDCTLRRPDESLSAIARRPA